MGGARIFRGGDTFSKDFSKICKKFQKIFKKFSKTYQKNFKKFSKILKNFLQKIAKMHYFSIFFKKVNKQCVNFWRVWPKKTIYWKFIGNFEIF